MSLPEVPKWDLPQWNRDTHMLSVAPSRRCGDRPRGRGDGLRLTQSDVVVDDNDGPYDHDGVDADPDHPAGVVDNDNGSRPDDDRGGRSPRAATKSRGRRRCAR